jgi:hypothetical protein
MKDSELTGPKATKTIPSQTQKNKHTANGQALYRQQPLHSYGKVEICSSSSAMHHLACLIVSLIRTCSCSTNSYMHAALRLTSGTSYRCLSLRPSACPPWSCSAYPSNCEAMRLIPSPHESQTSSGNMAIQASHTKHVLLLRTNIGYSASLASSSTLTHLRLKLHPNTLPSLQ